MRTFTHTSTATVEFRLDIGPGLVEIVAEDRADATVTLTLHGTRADLRTVSGDISVHATTNATVTATSVSGDIRVTSDPYTRVTTSLRSVSGDVRTA
jgi:DUF4097 and DUF4098 domain-containing protein YvlB